ncbi:MAG: hypothetical protein ABWW69_02535 [Pyrodictiaceae archaeon]
MARRGSVALSVLALALLVVTFLAHLEGYRNHYKLSLEEARVKVVASSQGILVFVETKLRDRDVLLGLKNARLICDNISVKLRILSLEAKEGILKALLEPLPSSLAGCSLILKLVAEPANPLDRLLIGNVTVTVEAGVR